MYDNMRIPKVRVVCVEIDILFITRTRGHAEQHVLFIHCSCLRRRKAARARFFLSNYSPQGVPHRRHHAGDLCDSRERKEKKRTHARYKIILYRFMRMPCARATERTIRIEIERKKTVRRVVRWELVAIHTIIHCDNDGNNINVHDV